MSLEFHGMFLERVADIERNFPVAEWTCGDLELWPLARMALYLDMYWSAAGAAVPRGAPLALRALTHLATPLTNAWKSRHHLAHWIVRPRPAHAIFLGDGVSLDRTDDGWQDRFGEPIMAALEQRGLSTFLMQATDLSRLPWRRPTFAANGVAVRGALRASRLRVPVALPGLAEMHGFLRDAGIAAPSLARDRLVRRARNVHATAGVFEHILRRVKPALAFVVTYYAGLGAAYLLACRRQGVLSVDLQHCPQSGAHKAYRWAGLPATGYAALPAVFWNWTAGDAADIEEWTGSLAAPWHRSLHGGHTQLGAFLDGTNPQTQRWDAAYHAVGTGQQFERDILVALQPLAGQRAAWEAMRTQIEAAPRSWRWWIRRHPAARPFQDEEYRQLLSLTRPNVVIEAASSLPLPALLRHMDALVSLASGAAAEAAVFGVPAFFLSADAHATFPGLIARGQAAVIDVRTLDAELARAARRAPGAGETPAGERPPPIETTLRTLEALARDYAVLRASRGCA